MPKKTRVFLDANVLIRAGKPPGGPEIQQVIDLVDAGEISVVTTDHTINEVTKRHTENDYNLIKDLGRPAFRHVAKDALGIELPDISKTQAVARLPQSG